MCSHAVVIRCLDNCILTYVRLFVPTRWPLENRAGPLWGWETLIYLEILPLRRRFFLFRSTIRQLFFFHSTIRFVSFNNTSTTVGNRRFVYRKWLLMIVATDACVSVIFISFLKHQYGSQDGKTQAYYLCTAVFSLGHVHKLSFFIYFLRLQKSS